MVDGPVRVTVDAAEFRRLMLEVKGFDAKMAASIRRNLRTAGEAAAGDVRSALGQAPPSGGRRSVGVRAALAAGTKVVVGTKAPGVKITTSGKALPPAHQPMLRLYNKAQWRHPVFASYGKRSGLKKAAKASKGSLRSALRGLDRALADRDRRKAVWVAQKGRPYFGTVIQARRDDMERAVLAAMDEAAEAIAHRT